MRRTFLIAIASSLLLSTSLVGQQNFAGGQAVRSPGSPAVASSPVPLPPEKMTASPPEVQFQQGLLTIKASNSTLGDILNAVRKETGASVDLPGNVTERVVGQFGPGPARDVLASLLNGSHFNYVLLGSAENYFALGRIVLISSSGANDQRIQTANASQQNRSDAEMMTRSKLPPAILAAHDRAVAARSIRVLEGDEQSSDDSVPDAVDSADADEQGTGGQADDQQQQSPVGQPGDGRTPGQLLQQLQQRQQQVQQQGFPNASGYPPAPGLPQPQ